LIVPKEPIEVLKTNIDNKIGNPIEIEKLLATKGANFG
jgi:hypothetical protein